jgi:UDP-2,3-diacylglucosamine hydrolase
LLCTDDDRYLALRHMVRNQHWQRDFLAKRLPERRTFAHKLRETSRVETAEKPAEIMDVNAGTVAKVMREHGVQALLHGHTHRPAIHHFALDSQPAQRIVLGAWYEQGSYCRWSDAGAELRRLTD